MTQESIISSAYKNDEKIKRKFVNRAVKHRRADEIVKGLYWNGKSGCCVGCLAHVNTDAHEALEEQANIPLMVSKLADSIHEGLPSGKYQKWPERFVKSIKTGSDLSLVGWKFLHWNLTENLILKDSQDKDVQKSIIECREAIKKCADVLAPMTKGKPVDKDAARSAARRAERAAWSAESAAWRAASAESAARRAASAESAESAAWRAASAASAESAASTAWSTAWSAAWGKMADKLIELLEAA